MASRLARRVLAHSVRPAARVSAPAGRRFASTSPSHAAKQSSDTPWIIGSALVFGPVMAYLLTPTAKSKAAHTAASKHQTAGHGAVHDDGADASEPTSNVDASEKQAIDADSPKDAHAAEEGSAPTPDDGNASGASELTDSEGNTASADDVNASLNQASNADSPADAQREEAQEDKYASGAPGQTEESETDHEQKEKPTTRSNPGTSQSGPTDQGDARKAGVSKQAPKQADQD
ncbi:hypothetical protein K466DRAFT_595724 [Polyporus arcularius HHB13444]|uniref:Uncharacterized protein n=1 Tax=Polyporus arcularius HHB13444 TaxID=1314778 RepID=A0A5C3PTC4_9APHY|nr:hypothetical protein K466DRAFT_595724 [Polyporus arcularius HHB13444]